MPDKNTESMSINSLSELMSPAALKLLTASGGDFVKQIGIDVVRGVVFDILTGRNLRDSTEMLTRRRIASLNLATVNMFLQGSRVSSDFVNKLPGMAAEILTRKNLSKSERWICQWVLGLTDKAFQNVLRDDASAIKEYRDRYIETCKDIIASHQKQFGRLTGVLKMDSEMMAEINWMFMTYLLNTIGAQTLAVRGSEKSAYGKLFEKLILGSLLHILGFKYVSAEHPEQLNRVFWLASRGERRESDATLLYEAGKGVRFDIGFIGRGNPEISLDKVTRFEREISMGRSHWYLATIIIVDRIGEHSRIERLAEKIDGKIIQMSGGYWPQEVARALKRIVGYKGEILEVKPSGIGKFLDRKLKEVPLESFITYKNKQ